MIINRRTTIGIITAILVALAIMAGGQSKSDRATETRAIEFLKREVPAWSKNNGCFSCHNNGDAARALFTASGKGFEIPESVLVDTVSWLGRPGNWDDNKGDPGFSDKRLANLQFATALRTAIETGHIVDRRALDEAARKLTAGQSDDGSWKIDEGNTLGSPATYGTPLATLMALKILRAADLPDTRRAARKAEDWLNSATTNNIFTAAVLLIASTETGGDSSKRETWLKMIRNAQTDDGGWGPYPDSPPEAFDTSMALLALAKVRDEPGVSHMIRLGRRFLIREQRDNGSWPATTRPSGVDSYAQMVSTTGWATLALIETGN